GRPLGRCDLARSARSDGRARPRLAGIGADHLPAGIRGALDRPLARHQHSARPPGSRRGRDPGRARRRPAALPPFAIPATLHDSLAARLERRASVKEIGQVGAAIGREFSSPLLRAVAGRGEPALRAALAQLEEAELLFRSGAPPDARYTFKHALVQDTAYETLLKSRRRILHRQIADALRAKFAAAAAAPPGLVAPHPTPRGRAEAALLRGGTS